MSTTASVYVLKATDVQAVTAAGPHGVLDALQARGQEVDDAYFWPGHNLLFVIRHLWDAEGLTLFSVLYRDQEQRLTDEKNVTIILGPEHKQLLPQLEPFWVMLSRWRPNSRFGVCRRPRPGCPRPTR